MSAIIHRFSTSKFQILPPLNFSLLKFSWIFRQNCTVEIESYGYTVSDVVMYWRVEPVVGVEVNHLLFFLYLCICVFVCLCICVFVYFMVGVEVNNSLLCLSY